MAAIAMYGMYLSRHRFSEPQLKEEEDQQYSYRTAPMLPPPNHNMVVEAVDVEPELIIPPLAQRYLDSANKLEEDAIEHDLEGHHLLGNMDRKSAEKNRRKAQEIIDKANGE